MIEVPDKLYNKISRSFPVMNVVIGNEDGDYNGHIRIREYGEYIVTLVIGISNVTITKIEKKEENNV